MVKTPEQSEHNTQSSEGASNLSEVDQQLRAEILKYHEGMRARMDDFDRLDRTTKLALQRKKEKTQAANTLGHFALILATIKKWYPNVDGLQLPDQTVMLFDEEIVDMDVEEERLLGKNIIYQIELANFIMKGVPFPKEAVGEG